MKTCVEIRSMILSAPDVEAIDKIICDNYDFTSFGEKIAFLKGMFGTEIIEKINNDCEKETYFSILYAIISSPIRNNRAVKKTLTIPAWLNAISEINNINFSETLTNALKEKLGLK